MADNMIALQTMLPKIDTPFEAQGKALQLRQMMNASQDADYERQQRAQVAQDDASYRQALQANPTGGAGLLSALAGSGNYKAHAAAVKSDLDQRKGNADIEKDQATTNETKLKALNQAFTLHRDQVNLVNDPQTAAQWVASAYKDPVLGPLVAQSGPIEAAISRIPKDPAGFAQWKMQAGLSADDYVKRTTISAEDKAKNDVAVENSKRSAASSKYSADSSAGTARARLNYDREKDAGSEDAALDPLSVRTIAQQYLAGDNTALGNIGRGTQGAKNISAVRNEISRQANAQGLNGADIAAKIAEFGGLKAGNRTLGTRTANIEVAATEAAELAPLALEASAKVARSGLLPFGKMQIMFDTQTNDPNLRQFAMANTALANAYGQVMSRGGVATVSDKEHARELLATSFDQPSYAAAVEQLQAEIRAAQRAPGKVRKEMSAAASGRTGDHGKPATGGVVNFGDLK